MDKLRSTIAQYSRWKELDLYIERIEVHLESDFSISVENAKALLESIGKEICSAKHVTLPTTSSMNAVLKKAFCALGYPNENLVNQVSGALATIAQQIGNLRNDISPTSHGRSLEDLRDRNTKVDILTREFLIDSTLTVAVFLIRAFEERKTPAILMAHEAAEAELLQYNEEEDFNESWDEVYGEFEMGEYSYTASEILFHLDYKVYEAECRVFKESELKIETGEGS
ncbi:abortive infection family protein [Nostoc sp. FACHB-973]|nr:abortive infection family protein [Nostoc sp. FACHB-973]